MTVPPAGLLDRAAGALWGLAIGDAMGMPTQLLSRAEILEQFGSITGFQAAGDSHPIAAGLAAGTITDDTQQAVLLAEQVLAGGRLDQRAWATALMGWQDRMRTSGSLDLLGPSTSAALDALQAAAPLDEVGRAGTTNGAAMRICPVGIATSAADLDALVDRVVDASKLTHNTSLALAAAAAVAAAVSAGIDGQPLTAAIDVAVRAADIAATRGHWVAGASVARRIAWGVAEAGRMPASAVPTFVAELVGTSLASQESVPAAFAIVAAFPADPWGAVCTAASVGGDCDTIGAIVGAIAGASLGVAAFPPDAVSTVRAVNGLDMDILAERLVELRCH